MTTRLSTQPTEQPGREPVFVGSANRTEVYAHFKSGTIVRTPRSRSRSYPGLRGGAPPTRAFYAELARRCRGGVCLDVGCGAGEGASVMRRRAGRVIGLERDSEALVFAREYTDDVEVVSHDIEQPFPELQASHVIIADVLGHVKQPLAVLMHVREAAEAHAQIVIAEPSAVVRQRLTAPLRRAFSSQELQRLLTRAGLALDGWIMQRGSFVACWAWPVRTLWADALVEAAQAEHAGDFEAARDAFSRGSQGGNAATTREAHLGEARCEIQLGQGDAAVGALNAAQAADPECAATYAAMAEIALLTDDPRGALGLSVRALELEPTEPCAARIAAHAAELLGHPDAPAAWRTALSLAPDRVDVAGEVARICAERGDYAGGIHVFDRLRAYGEIHSAAFHVTFGWLLLSDGRMADARLEAELAVQLAPEDDAVAELWGAIRESALPQ